jgi:periplasmic copper chaperone A
MSIRRVLLVAAAAGCLLAPAAGLAMSLFIVTEPWVRLSPDARSGEAYMQLRSAEGAAVVGVRSEVAPGVTMRPPGKTPAAVSEIRLPAGVTVMLTPGEFRMVLPTLERPLKLGDRVPLVLTIRNTDGSRQEIPVDAEVRRHSPTDDHLRPHKH